MRYHKPDWSFRPLKDRNAPKCADADSRKAREAKTQARIARLLGETRKAKASKDKAPSRFTAALDLL